MVPHTSRRSFLASVVGASATFAGCSETAPPEPLTEIWSAEVGVSSTGYLSFTEDAVVTGSWDGEVSVIDRKTGSVRNSHYFENSHRRGAAVWFGPFLVDDIILVGGELRILAMDFDGNEVWSREFEKTALLELHLLDEVLILGTRDGALEAIDATTGEHRWSSDVVNDTEVRDVADDGRSLFFTTVTEIVAIDPSDGSERWSHGIPLDAYVAASEKHVIVTSEFHVTAFHPTTGDRLWQRETGYIPSRSSVVDSQVYLWGRTPNGAGPLTILDPETGDERWRTTEHRIQYFDRAQGHLYALSEQNVLISITTDGAERWSVPVDKIPLYLTVIDESELFVFSNLNESLRKLAYSG